MKKILWKLRHTSTKLHGVTSPEIVILGHSPVKYPSRLTFSICAINPLTDVDRTAILLFQKSILNGTEDA
jgi:hypothetical protein